MAAGLGFKDFTTGEVLTAADVDGYLMQGVWVFADAAARTAAVTSPQEGNMSFLKDTNSTEYYSGSAWVAIDGSVPTSYGYDVGKNCLINGGFDIWQRGTSAATAGGSYVSADRWWAYTASGSATFGQETTIIPAGSQYASKITSTGAGTSIFIAQAVETLNAIAYAGKTVVFTGQVAASTSVPLTIQLQYSTSVDNAVGGSWTTITPTSGGTITPTSTTYVPFTAVYIIPSTAKSLRAGVYHTGTVANGVVTYIAQMQLEIGSTATQFTRTGSTIQGELAACQRYYVRIGDSSGASNQRLARGSANTTTGIQLTATLPVQLRTGASSTVDYANLQWFNGSAGVGAISSVTMSATSTTNPAIAAVTTGVVAGTFYELLTTSTAGYIGFSAEL